MWVKGVTRHPRFAQTDTRRMARTILIADDNALVRAALRQVLEDEKLGEVVEAENGQQAILMSQEMKPALIILDLAMPFLDGFSTARELSRLLPGIPILMHTLYYSARVEVEAMKVGVRKTVAKSNSTVLIEAVRELLPPIAASAELSGGAPTITGAEAEKSNEEKQSSVPKKDDLPQAS